MRKSITVIAAAAFLATGTFAAAPAFAAKAKAKPAEQQAMHPLPAIGVLPAMMMFGSKENKKFKPYKPYGKNTRTSI